MSQLSRRGRPVEKPIAERIPDTPRNIARAVVNTPQKMKRSWKYLKGGITSGTRQTS